MKTKPISEPVIGSFDGRTIAFVRPRDKLDESANLVSTAGGRPYPVDILTVRSLIHRPEVESFFEELCTRGFDYSIFMSTNGVEHFVTAGEKYRPQHYREALGRSKVIAVGPKTAQQLARQELPCHEIPDRYSSSGIIASMEVKDLSEARVAIPRARNASPSLREGLADLGAKVTEVFLYELEVDSSSVKTMEFLRGISRGRIDAVVFTSSAIAQGVLGAAETSSMREEVHRKLASNVLVVAIGPLTASTLREMGLRVVVEPRIHTFRGAVASLTAQYQKSNEL
ncbi:MAG: uroporphyrinogen-III synthase [Candidatus Geothermarchaeales archaeon]